MNVERAGAASRAVFLSYASQDAEAARRICETLRASGIEVWFDADGGLEHGDEWDAKIRKQIKDCVLFIAVISANTQARHEGYFRIEWELAAQRAMGIASGVPFILPVVIDDTREPDALVPDRFRAVQWTKLRAGEVPPEVQQRFLKLWSHRTGVLKNETARTELEPGRLRPVQRDEGVASPSVTPEVGRRVPAAAWVAGALTLLVGGFFLAKRPAESPPPTVQHADAGTRPPTAEKTAAPATEAQQLVAKIWTLLNDPSLDRAKLETADDLGKRATSADPNDASAWAAWSQVDSWAIYHGFAPPGERTEAARTKAVKALQLAPDSFESRLAHACFAVRSGGSSVVSTFSPQAEASLRSLLKERPAEPRTLLTLAILLRNLQQLPEARALLTQLTENPTFSALAWNELGWIENSTGNFRAAEAAVDRSIARQPYWGNLSQQMELALWWRGDVARAQQILAKVSLADLQEDWFVAAACRLYTVSGDHAKVLRTLNAASRNWLRSNYSDEPTGYLAGHAHAAENRPDAARLNWEAALKVVEQRLVGDPKSANLLHWKGELLVQLGRRTEGESFLKLSRDLAASDSEAGFFIGPIWYDQLLLGKLDEAERSLADALAQPTHSYVHQLGFLKLEPRLQPLRSRPSFQALVARIAADPSLAPPTQDKPTPAVSAPDPKSVAVLAFANQSDDKANEYFSDGIADELQMVLKKIPGLRVAAQTSAFSFKGKNTTAKEVGEKLGMAHVVSGTVQKSGNRVKITARLNHAATNEEVWLESFGPLELTDLFATQSEIAQKIVAGLRGLLTGETGTTPAAAAAQAEIKAQVQAATKGGTKNSEAHQLYLQGKYFAARFSQENFEKAVGFFRRAVELDASFALAWAALSQTNSVRWSWGALAAGADQITGEARRAASRAIALEPELAEGHAASFEAQVAFEFDWRGAEMSARKALAFAPSDATHIGNAAKIALFTGKLERGIELFRQALALDPNNTELRVFLACALHDANRMAEAVAEHRRTLAINPAATVANGLLSYDLTRSGLLDEALAAAEREQESWARHLAFAVLRWAQKKQPDADAALRVFIDLHATDAAYNIAQVYGFRGDADQAFAWLDRAHRQRDSGICWVKVDRFFHPLHSDPRWPVFLRKLGLADDQLK